MNKILFYILLSITCMVLLATCTPAKKLVKQNEPIVTKNGRWVPGNAKAFQQRHDAKLKRQIQKDSANKKK